MIKLHNLTKSRSFIIIGKIIGSIVIAAFLIPLLTIHVYGKCDNKTLIDLSCYENANETKYYYDVPVDNDMQDYIREMLKEFEVDIQNGLEVVLAMAYTESRFKTDVKNGSCKGIMQVSEIHSETLEYLEIQDLYDPYDCFKAGVYYLKQGLENADELWDELTDCTLSKDDFRLNCALMSYNLGNYGAKTKISKGVYSTSYVEKVCKAMSELELRLDE